MSSNDLSEYESTDEQGSFADIDTDQLHKLLEEALSATEFLNHENDMFERYLQRVEPAALLPDKDEMVLSPNTLPIARSTSHERLLCLTAEQKCEIAQWEIEQLRDMIEKCKDESERLTDSYKAMTQESDIRCQEIQRSMIEFDRDIVRGGVNPITGDIIGEKVDRYFRDREHNRAVLIEKLSLKTSALRTERRKILACIRQKQEMGEFLHPVDFDKLQIENSQCLQRIESKNQELLQLKCLTCNITQRVNSLKKKLSLQNNESQRMQGEMRIRLDLMRRVEQEALIVKEERQKAKLTNNQLKGQLAGYRVPPIMNYVKCVEANKMVVTKHKSWERKLDIAKMALHHHRKMWRKVAKETKPN